VHVKSFNRDPDKIELATNFAVRDYRVAIAGRDQKAIAEAIRRRFSERYVAPVSQPPHRHGFAMMAISCLMIEAFESFRQGWATSNGQSKAAFCFFFDRASIFTELRGHAQEFYKNVRCGILHQAETTGGWTIARRGRIFDPDTLTINAALFLKNLQRVLDEFCDELHTSDWDSPEWKNVRKKMDAICAGCRKSPKKA
jgi:hypothetical protein